MISRRTFLGVLAGLAAFKQSFAANILRGPSSSVASGSSGAWSVRSSLATGGTTTASIAVTAGDFIAVLVGGQTTGTLTCSDNAGGGSNAYTPMATSEGDRPQTFAIFGAVAKATENIAITVGGTANPEQLMSGIFYAATGTPSLTADATASEVTNHSDTISPTLDACLILAFADSSGGNPTEGTNFTLIGAIAGGGSRAAAEYDLTGTLGAQTVAFVGAPTPRGMLAIAVKSV